MLYVGVLFYLILQFLRPQEFFYILRGLPLVYYTMLILLPFWLATTAERKILRTPEDLFMFLLWAVGVLSWWSYWKSHMFLPAWDLGKTLLSYLFVVHVTDSRRRLSGAVWMVMLMLLIVSMTAATVRSGPTKGQYACEGTMFDNRNDFAYAMAIMVPLGFAFLVRGDPLGRIVGLGVVVAGVAEIIATGSRGGGLAAFFALYTIIYMQAKSKWGRRVMLVGGVIALLVVFAFSERLASVTEYQQDASAMGRVDIWARALEIFREHPLVGCGMGTWEDQPKTERDTHNSFMRAIAELGGTGLFVYIGLLFFALRDAHNITLASPHPTIRVVALGLTGVLVGQIVAGLFQTRLYHVFVLVLVGLVSALRLVTQKEWAALEPAAAGPGPPSAPHGGNPGIRAPTPGFGLRERRLVSKKELLIVAALTFLCWLAHKLFIKFS